MEMNVGPHVAHNSLCFLLIFGVAIPNHEVFIPILNIIAVFKISIDVAKQFGQGVGFGLGLAILSFIFWPLLGFGDYQYSGGSGGDAAAI